MGLDLTGIVSPGGAKAKAELLADSVVFRGDIKQEVGFEEITAEARGGLLVLSFRGRTVELSAGAKAAALAAQIRSPPSRLDRLGIELGQSAAVAGAIDPGFKAELGTRAAVAQGPPRAPVDVLVYAANAPADLEVLPKLAPLVGGTLWVVIPSAPGSPLNEAKVAAAAKPAGLKVAGQARFSPTHAAIRLQRGAA
jgi:hypothetical protein